MTPETLLESSATEAPTAEAIIAEHLATAKRQSLTDPADRPNENTSSRAKLYRLFWRWHFYAGMFVAPIILTASITGGLYVFIDELVPLMYPELMSAEPPAAGARNLTLAELGTAVMKEHPQAKLLSVAQPVAPGLNAELAMQLGKDRRTAMVDPTTGRVAGLYDGGSSFFGIVLGLHRRLLLGTPGRITVELAASWGIVLIITGTYLWWPRRTGRAASPGAGVWYPRLRAPLTVVLRDLHTVVGFYGVATAAIILATGLFFTQFFGNGYKMLTNNFGSAPAVMKQAPKSEPANGRARISPDAALSTAEALLPGQGPIRVGVPASPTDSFRVQRVDDSSPTLKTTVFVDAYSGKVNGSFGWDDISTLHKIRSSIYPIHVGSIYGLPTKILALLTCLALTLLSITGVWMWWRRRPRGTWGLAPSTANIAIPRWLLGLIVVLGVLMPAMGMSLALILVVDFAVVRFLAFRRRSSAAG